MRNDKLVRQETIDLLRHIFDARIDNAETQSEYVVLCDIRDIVEYALANNIECLAQFDYLETDEEKHLNDEPSDIDSDFGFDPYEGCFTYDC